MIGSRFQSPWTSRALFRTLTIFTSHTLVVRMSRKQYAYALWALSIGVATVANKKALFVTLVDRIPRFDAHWSQFFAEFDWFVVLTSRLHVYISRYGDFCAHDNDTTDYSRASEQRTLWERASCPLFGGCPYLGGSWFLNPFWLYYP